MSSTGTIGLGILLLFILLMLAFASLGRRWETTFRELPGLDALGNAIERAVESGKRVHLSLGTGSVSGTDSAPALAGLALLKRIAAITSMSDKPVVATTGDGAMALLAQDSLRTAYGEVRRQGSIRAHLGSDARADALLLCRDSCRSCSTRRTWRSI